MKQYLDFPIQMSHVPNYFILPAFNVQISFFVVLVCVIAFMHFHNITIIVNIIVKHFLQMRTTINLTIQRENTRSVQHINLRSIF